MIPGVCFWSCNLANGIQRSEEKIATIIWTPWIRSLVSVVFGEWFLWLLIFINIWFTNAVCCCNFVIQSVLTQMMQKRYVTVMPGWSCRQCSLQLSQRMGMDTFAQIQPCFVDEIPWMLDTKDHRLPGPLEILTWHWHIQRKELSLDDKPCWNSVQAEVNSRLIKIWQCHGQSHERWPSVTKDWAQWRRHQSIIAMHRDELGCSAIRRRLSNHHSTENTSL